MGAILGGTMRSPFTGMVFMIELTHDVNMMLPLLTAVLVAHAFTVLALRRSILTEKISRRGLSSDPRIFFRSAGDSVRPRSHAHQRRRVAENVQGAGLAHRISKEHHRGQILYPVVDQELRLTGVITGTSLKEFLNSTDTAPHAPGQNGTFPSPAVTRNPVVAYPDEPLRAVVYRMAETGKTRFPVVDPADSHKLLGLISLNDLLHARVRALDEERKRERVLRIRFPRQVS